MKSTFVLLSLLMSLHLLAQNKGENTPSFFDDSELKEYSIQNILVEGEVENPSSVDLQLLYLNSFPTKIVVYGKDKNKFTGSYFVSGYSLFDIINQKKIKKANEAEFKPAVDLYVVVESDKGEKVVFSWGELFYSKNNYRAIIAKSVRSINPSKMKMKWTLPESTMLICGDDAFNFRSISNPTKITVKSFAGNYSKERVKEIYTPEFTFVNNDVNVTAKDISGIERRKFRGLGYGHGMGWKGTEEVEGFVFKDVINKYLTIDEKQIASTILCISAKDGYRVTYSLSEIVNRNDMNDFLLIEKNSSLEEGKYNLVATPDFFVDRNVRSVEKIEILNVK
ncbi:MAG: Molybdopterin oxidoreductase/precorrin-4 methylase [Ignavibacteria bacterium]|nr:MAG: Molybdopterin oxidoreductase/precorrin-4 methylase [Ignavibacteria bacterium]KAF0160679.1 MAG: Molybdopterin oxidoreductase/precorrin-4 methylase [Ignavibacteria bacterium]